MKHLRAVLILLHVVAVTALAFPAPVGGMNERAFAQPSVQASFESTAATLRSLGLDVSKDALQAWLWGHGNRFMAVRKQLLRPLHPYADLTGSHQGWRMFSSLNRRAAWLVVDLEEGGDMRTIYRMRSDRYTWRRRQLDQERTRALVNGWCWGRNKGSYKRFAQWLGRQAAADFPDATAIRVHMDRAALPDPATLHADGMPAGRSTWPVRVALEPLR